MSCNRFADRFDQCLVPASEFPQQGRGFEPALLRMADSAVGFHFLRARNIVEKRRQSDSKTFKISVLLSGKNPFRIFENPQSMCKVMASRGVSENFFRFAPDGVEQYFFF